MRCFDAAGLWGGRGQLAAQSLERADEEEAGGVGGRFQFRPDDGFMGTAKCGAAIDRKRTPDSKFSSASWYLSVIKIGDEKATSRSEWRRRGRE